MRLPSNSDLASELNIVGRSSIRVPRRRVGAAIARVTALGYSLSVCGSTIVSLIANEATPGWLLTVVAVSGLLVAKFVAAADSGGFEGEFPMHKQWLNEPEFWKEDNGVLSVRTGLNTDFWNRTFYGFTHANGHFQYVHASDDFTATVSISAAYSHLYDQAGLMLMCDEENWMKCGIEFTDAMPHFSTVVTRSGFSDWSQQPVSQDASDNFEVRISRHQEALRVQYKVEGQTWTMARLAMLPMETSVRIGVMCCSPSRQGLDVRFKGFTVAEVISRNLHD